MVSGVVPLPFPLSDNSGAPLVVGLEPIVKKGERAAATCAGARAGADIWNALLVRAGRCASDIGGIGSDCDATELLVAVRAPRLRLTARIDAPPSRVRRGRTRSLK